MIYIVIFNTLIERMYTYFTLISSPIWDFMGLTSENCRLF